MSGEAAGCRVLIVEDEGLLAMFLEDMLAELGYEVVAIAGNVERATELLVEVGIDVAILDVNLNGEYTYPLATVLTSRGIPFIFTTGYGRASLPDTLQKTPVLQKPYQQQTLRQALRTVLAN